MTGHGRGDAQSSGWSGQAEVRSVNNRYLKVTLAGADGMSWAEPLVMALVRQFVKRGTVHVTLRARPLDDVDTYRINAAVLRSYLRQLESLPGRDSIRVDTLLGLPGVVEQPLADAAAVDAQWTVLEAALRDALTALAHMRQEEGRLMTSDFENYCRSVGERLTAIAQRAPRVVEQYGERLGSRIRQWMAAHELTAPPGDLVREIGLFADRCDISEELVRLTSHVAQFRATLASEVGDGRKLDFLTQEMLREANTIGAKANDAEIAIHVVELKTLIERIRELTQNVE